MSVVSVNLPEKRYEIQIRRGLLEKSGQLAARVLRGRKVAVVTDSTVGPLYAKCVLGSFSGAGFAPELLTVPAGETSKSPAMLAWLWERMADVGLTRSDAVVALGGGVVGDLAGFAAATMLRGVDLIQIPTTLLAQVDSSVGGKVAVDLSAGKNLAGCFYQPKLVVIDPQVLETLPDRVFADGMAEVIKYGCILDAAFFERLNQLGCRNGIFSHIEEIVAACCDSKRRVVEEDERDTGARMILNFGHTFGHVYEKAYHYETYTHGEAVAAGMVDAARLGERMGYTQPGTVGRITGILDRFGLPTAIPASRADFVQAMSLDKKSLGDEIRFIFLKRIGEAVAVRLRKEELFQHL